MSETTRDELYPRPEDLKELPSSEAPPAWLEDRVMEEARREGLLGHAAKRRGRPLMWGAAAAMAAGLTAFAVGIVVGRGGERPLPAVEDQRPRFVLLLYEDDAYLAPAPGEMDRRVAEYAGWAGGLRGHLVSGEKLKDEDLMLGPPSPVISGGPGHLAGYFVMAARDSAQAEELARGCPHLRYGGRISIRAIDPT